MQLKMKPFLMLVQEIALFITLLSQFLVLMSCVETKNKSSRTSVFELLGLQCKEVGVSLLLQC